MSHQQTASPSEVAFAASTEKWRELYSNGQFSVPTEMGKVAILCSHWSNLSGKQKRKEVKQLAQEADDVAEQLRGADRYATVLQNTTCSDLVEAVQDPEVSDLILVGHGSFSSFSLPAASGIGRFGWKDAAEVTTHLKTGCVVQRTCGLYSQRPAVPLGLFVVNNPSNVWAAGGKFFEPKDIDDPINDLLQPITDQTDLLNLEYIRQTFVGGDQPTRASQVALSVADAIAASFMRTPY